MPGKEKCENDPADDEADGVEYPSAESESPSPSPSRYSSVVEKAKNTSTQEYAAVPIGAGTFFSSYMGLQVPVADALEIFCQDGLQPIASGIEVIVAAAIAALAVLAVTNLGWGSNQAASQTGGQTGKGRGRLKKGVAGLAGAGIILNINTILGLIGVSLPSCMFDGSITFASSSVIMPVTTAVTALV